MAWGPLAEVASVVTGDGVPVRGRQGESKGLITSSESGNCGLP